MKGLLAALLILMSMPAMAHHKHHARASSISMTTTGVSEKIDRFAAHMAEKYDFSKQELHDFLTRIQPDTNVFKFFSRKAKKNYTPEELAELKLLAELRIENGLKFWNAHEDALSRAEKVYGVPAEDIVGLIGIETAYGSYLGKFKAHQVLTTLAFYGSHRSAYFQYELEHFLVLAREYAWDRTNVPCSYAGAVGIPQFMPDNMKPYAVDFDNDGRVDLMDPNDAIGSVANYLAQHGWVRNQPIAVRTNARVGGKTFVLRTLPGPAPTIWRKQENFKVIRAYNPLDSYVMAIFILANKVKEAKAHQVVIPNVDEIQILVPPEELISPEQFTSEAPDDKIF